jgi:hypothetical protein
MERLPGKAARRRPEPATIKEMGHFVIQRKAEML